MPSFGVTQSDQPFALICGFRGRGAVLGAQEIEAGVDQRMLVRDLADVALALRAFDVVIVDR